MNEIKISFSKVCGLKVDMVIIISTYLSNSLFVKWHFFFSLILLKQKITMKINNLFVFIVLGFVRDNETADITTTTPQISSPNLLRSISTPFGSSLDRPNQDRKTKLVGKLSEMINRLQRWANDISKQPKQKIKSRGNENQRFLCFGHEAFCKELVYINNAENYWEDYVENMEETKDPSETYIPVGFLNPLLVQQSEKMYENLNKNLNKDKSYRASLSRNNVQKTMADRVF